MSDLDSSKLGPRLQQKLRSFQDEVGTTPPGHRVGVMVDFSGNVDPMKSAGLKVKAVVGGIASGSLDLSDLEALLELDTVTHVSLEQNLRPQLDNSLRDINAHKVHAGSPTSYRGNGVIVGVIDTGIDIYHGAFRKPNNDQTRILGILDFSCQEIEITGNPTAGTFTLNWQPLDNSRPRQSTSEIPYDASASMVKFALESLGSVQKGDVETGGGPLPADPVVVKLTGRYSKFAGNDSYEITSSGSLGGGSSPAVTVNGQHKFDEEDINDALSSPNEPFLHEDHRTGHGTHVAGIAAGDGSQPDKCRGPKTFVGVAPEADIVVVKTPNFSDNNAIAGIQYIFGIAQPPTEPNKPAVINMSFGRNNGPHNGTSKIERSIDGKLDNSSGGEVIVTSAGNTGDKKAHAVKQISAGGNVSFNFFIGSDDKQNDRLEIWYQGNMRLGCQIQDPNNRTVSVSPPGSSSNSPNTNGINGVHVESHVNQSVHNEDRNVNRHSIIIYLWSSSSNSPITSGSWTITLNETTNSRGGEIHVWSDYQKNDVYPIFRSSSGVERNATVGIPGTANNVITVGSYVQSNNDPNRRSNRKDKVAGFSSRGPTIDGRTKPEITAPGFNIRSAMNDIPERPTQQKCSTCCQEFYANKGGTSQAAPHVSGVAALMLDKDPSLTYDDIRLVIECTARTPKGVSDSSLPDNKWGEGIVDALGAVTTNVEDCTNGNSGNGGGGGGGSGTPSAPSLLHFTEESTSLGSSLLADLHAVHQKLLSTPLGHSLAVLLSTHFSEVHRLIRTNRKVATLWHRCGGPALVRGLLAWAREREGRAKEIATENLHEEPFQQLLDRLARHGSNALQADVERHRSLLSTLTQALA